MMDFSGNNRGYAFVMYASREDAKKAVKQLNNFEIRKGRYLGVCSSVDNCRLFVGGIPKNKKREEILSEMSKVTDQVVDVIVYPSLHDKTKNRGFAFVEYENHRAAAMARRKLIPGRIQLWSHQIMVDWAEPEEDVDEEIMKNVKILYVRNLMLHTTEESIQEAFNKVTEGGVERVKKLRDFAFVHFRTVEEAHNALRQLDGNDIDGAMVEVVLAKPVDKNARNQMRPFGRGYIQPNPYQEFGFNMMPGPAAPQSFNSNFNPLSMGIMPGAGRGQMVPRGAMRGRGRGAGGSRGAGGTRHYSPFAAGRGGFGNFYNKRIAEPRLYDIVPGMELTPTNPLTLKPEKNSGQVLEDLCNKNKWGTPQYTLLSSMQGELQLFVFKMKWVTDLMCKEDWGDYRLSPQTTPTDFNRPNSAPRRRRLRSLQPNTCCPSGLPVDGDEVTSTMQTPMASTTPTTTSSMASSPHLTNNGGSPPTPPTIIITDQRCSSNHTILLLLNKSSHSHTASPIQTLPPSCQLQLLAKSRCGDAESSTQN
ncbi:putative APOBEC1 complementation factor isoform X5 [Apostichopus japonicus]|uniref:Putative APOBEC1 complementation factor isoform X5 n=1 Tax=Stichopus japonicus TaxID=307972 RepID=A0A2G8KQE5_STIJA|nr:putative APOBEC1 complementation factor isoform X5 [Apostichopus japonicus]